MHLTHRALQMDATLDLGIIRSAVAQVSLTFGLTESDNFAGNADPNENR